MKKSDISFSYPVRAWAVWLLSALFMFYKYALEVSPSVMTATLMSTFEINGVELGNLAASYFYAYLLLQIPAGYLLDRFGPRKTTTIAISVCALGSILFSASHHLWTAELGRFLIGAGAAFAAINCLKLTANWFPFRHFAVMAGLMMTIAMLGAVGGQAPLSAFITHFEWRFAMETIGIAGLVLALLFWFVVRDKAPSHTIERTLTSPKISLMKSLKEILKSSQSWWLSLYSGFAFAPVMVFGGLWGASFLSESYHLSGNVAAQAISLIFIGFASGAPVFGFFSDRMGKRKGVMYAGTILALITISFIIYVPGFSLPILLILLFLFGFSISSFLLCFTMIREISPPILAATAIGFMNAFDALFGAISDPLAGKILDSYWDGSIQNGARIFSIEAYQTAFLTLPFFLLIALFTLMKVKETYCKPSYPTSLP